MGWLNTSTHNLLSIDNKDHDHPDEILSSLSKKKKKPQLPGPSLPPDATHSQLFFTYVTHREEPPLAAVALGIWNTTSLPTDHIDRGRLWQTSHLLPFLGHITIERLACDVQELSGDDDDEGSTEDYVRIVINDAPQALPYCNDGPGNSCGLEEFAQHIKDRVEMYKDQEGACKKKED
jgi:hypothetical protein